MLLLSPCNISSCESLQYKAVILSFILTSLSDRYSRLCYHYRAIFGTNQCTDIPKLHSLLFDKLMFRSNGINKCLIFEVVNLRNHIINGQLILFNQLTLTFIECPDMLLNIGDFKSCGADNASQLVRIIQLLNNVISVTTNYKLSQEIMYITSLRFFPPILIFRYSSNQLNPFFS